MSAWGVALPLLVCLLRDLLPRGGRWLDVARLRREWLAFVEDVQKRQPTRPPSSPQPATQGGGKGIVVIGGRCHAVAAVGRTGRGCRDFTLDALLLLASLRKAGCRLPVELWHDHDRRLLGNEAYAASSLSTVAFTVYVRDIASIPRGSEVRGYQVIPFVILHSAFDEVLYLDADNVAVVDPSPVFSAAAYVETGAVFWPDSWNYNLWSPLWRIVRRTPMNLAAIETAQVLVDKVRHRTPLELALFWNFQGPKMYYHLSNGECDLFTFAWLAMSATFHVAPRMSYAGYMADQWSFCAHTFLHSHPDEPGRVLFAHRTSCRFSATVGIDECRWTAIKEGREPRGLPLDLISNHFVGDTCLQEVRGNCKCSKDGVRLCPCLDADTPLSRSEWANTTLAQLEPVERYLLGLRSRLLGNGSELLTVPWRDFARWSEEL